MRHPPKFLYSAVDSVKMYLLVASSQNDAEQLLHLSSYLKVKGCIEKDGFSISFQSPEGCGTKTQSLSYSP